MEVVVALSVSLSLSISQRSWIVRRRVEAHIAVVLPVDETLTWPGVVVDHPADTERVDVAEAAIPGRTAGVGFLVILPW